MPVGAIFLALVTFIWGSQRMRDMGTFCFRWCTVDGTCSLETSIEYSRTMWCIGGIWSRFFLVGFNWLPRSMA